jgi:prephenate dehydrogenase
LLRLATQGSDVVNALGMNTIFMEPEEHDKHVAYVSHLSHVSSFLLGQTVLDIEKDEKNIFNLAGSGFASTVRLAKTLVAMGAEEVEDDDEAFADKMQTLTAKLGEQMAKGAELDSLIRQKLGGLGYEF